MSHVDVLSNPADVLAALGVTVESVFVPFSQSRSKDQDTPNLNWRVTVKRNGRDVLTTDYSAGCARCPSYDSKVPHNWSRPASMWRRAVVAAECESGVKQRKAWGDSFINDTRQENGRKVPVRIEPSAVDVLYSLTMDSDVLDAGGFEEWATDYGYDTDSRKAVSTYRACLELALAMRAGFGPDGMAQLQTAFEDY